MSQETCGYHRNQHSIRDRYWAGWFVFDYITARTVGNRRRPLRRSAQYRGIHNSAQCWRLRRRRAPLRSIPHIAELQIGFARSALAGRSVNLVRLPHRFHWWILSPHRSCFVPRLPQILIWFDVVMINWSAEATALIDRQAFFHHKRAAPKKRASKLPKTYFQRAYIGTPSALCSARAVWAGLPGNKWFALTSPVVGGNFLVFGCRRR